MSDSPEKLSYDWDVHFGVHDDLRALDDFHLQMMGKKPIQSGSIQKHLHQEFTAVVYQKRIDMQEYFRMLSRPVNHLIGLADRHAEMCASRAAAIVDYLETLTDIFPEDRWRESLSYEVYSKGRLLEDIRDSLDDVRPVYMAGGRQYYTHQTWTSARQSLKITNAHFNEIQSRTSIVDGPPLAEAVLQHRSLKLADKQEQIAEKTLEHAHLQMVLARDCLRLATTISVLPPHYKAPLQGMVDSCAEVAENLMIASDFTLDEAADLRTSSHQSRDLRRPVF
ncbi:MAG: hypothetical protein ACXW30_04735 [Micavibrio sp.]